MLPPTSQRATPHFCLATARIIVSVFRKKTISNRWLTGNWQPQLSLLMFTIINIYTIFVHYNKHYEQKEKRFST